MTAASPVMKALHLEDHGLQWLHAPKVLAHLQADGPAAVLYRDAERTAAGIDLDHPGDGEPWRRLAREWDRFGDQMMAALLSPFPPVRAAVRLGMAARLDLWELIRRSVLPMRTMAEELFAGKMGPLLLAGNALHADVTPEAAPSAFLGWMLVGLAQTVGFPVPAGGSGRIIDALVHRLGDRGQIRLAEPVEQVMVTHGRATGVRTRGGEVAARHGVVAACDAQILYGRLVDKADLPPAFVARMAQFQRAGSTVKVDYALDRPVPWTDDRAVGAGTVHIADSVNELSITAAELATGRIPARPFLLIGQTTTADPSRSPAGTESLWVYTHVPQDIAGDAAGQIDATGRLDGPALDQFVDRVEARIEAHAPGFGNAVIARHVQGPSDLERANPSLVGGDISGGTAQLHQQLIFRPVPGLARAETPITGLYLASASAHPGGSVHGAGGANGARAALVGRRAPVLRRVGVGAGAGLAAVRLTARSHRGRS
jgi:phytoene dehydrogenase-like protein